MSADNSVSDYLTDISLSSTDLGELEEKLEVDYQFGEEVKEKVR